MLSDLESAFLLHSRPFRETSFLLDVFTKQSGRINIVARGIRNKKSAKRSLLNPFRPIAIQYSGKSELQNLRIVEPDGIGVHLSGNQLVSGLYINELLTKLLPKNDPYPKLFQYYQVALNSLMQHEDTQSVLRNFELHLLDVLGYAIPLTGEANTMQPFEASSQYLFISNMGFVLTANENEITKQNLFFGSSLLAIAQRDFSNANVKKDAKRLCKMAIQELLGGYVIRTRELWMV